MKQRREGALLVTIIFFIVSTSCFSQTNPPVISPSPYFTYGKGLGITSPDSLFMLNIRFRMQNRLALVSESESDLDIASVEARTRRLRLRLDGFIYTTRLTYLIQLAFTRSDMDYDDTGFPNVIRDAMIQYSVNEHFSIGLGQTKLPGNRQRVNSSGDLQLPDRSIVNSTFNIDRDFGLQLYYNNAFKGLAYVVRGAISSGDGRNITSSDRGLAYTGRLELLPFGKFTNGGDYFEGDLAREPKPKVSFGLTYSNNQNAIRTGGQLGKFLYESRDIQTNMFDFLIKYNGWAFAAEYLRRTTPNPITTNEDGDQRFVYVGHGQNFQGSYLFKNNFELVGRYSQVRPDTDIQLLEEKIQQYTMGVSKYIRGHRLKLQSDLTYETNTWLSGTNADHNNWQLRFQIEAGI
ncbi:porin [Ohtaekwangia koreensis]|uniref:Phosphate-selective porin O and P n=1 Tax=Ohtaekwangia koreensis TaxID=688867 RepID=A0A1T5IND1_9BACT|nr:porin [Ohtaekwangia koreensis]SKC40483.1 Phosphate-selective porin O and P [Ohtaekwangia koreensis]